MKILENEKIHLLKNQAKLILSSDSANVSLARVMAAAFAAQADLTLSEIDEIKVAVSEAVSNVVIHAYQNVPASDRVDGNYIELTMNLYDGVLEYVVADYGQGIADIAEAKKPSSSSDPERMGMGFVFMESFMDSLEVKSAPGEGTIVTMSKKTKETPEH